LISKKNIRYEGTLYSINEADATVALADVRSYGTEGREKQDPTQTYVPPQDVVHPYLLFRGCDIKDLHVHEKTPEEQSTANAPPSDPAIVSTEAPPAQQQQKKETSASAGDDSTKNKSIDSSKTKNNNSTSSPMATRNNSYSSTVKNSSNSFTNKQQQQKSSSSSQQTGANNSTTVSGGRLQPNFNNRPSNNNRYRNNGYHNRRPRKSDQMIGTGASLLRRKERGAVEGKLDNVGKDFDFESSAADFLDKQQQEENDGELGSDDPEIPSEMAYTKDDFFDSISCDAIDRRDGVDNRLRGSTERNLNTETFGAVSLGNIHGGGGRRGYNSRRRGGRGQYYNNRGRGRSNSNGAWRSTNNTRSNSNGRQQAQRGDGQFAQPPTARAGGER